VSAEIILFVGENRNLYKEVSQKVEFLFPTAELIWLRMYSEIKEFFEDGGVAKVIFLGEEPSDYKGTTFLMDLNELSENIPVIFA
jgi:hypothetical protein